MLDYKAFAIEAARREFPVRSVETLLETAVKNAEQWRAAYTQAQQQGEWTIARHAAEELEFWTHKAAMYAAMQS